MHAYYGVMGYNFTKPFTYAKLDFIPLYTDLKSVKPLADDPEQYYCTGFFKLPEKHGFDINFLRDLTAVLSFIDHRAVRINGPYFAEGDDDGVKQIKPLRIEPRNFGGANNILEDSYSSHSRSRFVTLAMNQMSSPVVAHGYKQCFHKYVATFTGATIHYLDTQYFYFFSGLEALAREREGDFSSNAAAPISRFLIKLKFNVAQDDPKDDIRSITNYCHVRNALFHNGEYEKTVNVNGVTKTLRLSDYYAPLSSLVSLALMKHVDFDDGHINWNSWRDRQPFISKT